MRRLVIVVAVLVLSTGVAGGVIAASRSSDEAALAPTRSAADRTIERRVDRLLRKMTPVGGWAGSSVWWIR